MKKTVNICPKCGSTNIKHTSKIRYDIVAFGAPVVFKCEDCGFCGKIFPEIDFDKVKDFKKAFKNASNKS
jgi:predicted RNA-binding Zn-ribbon protein involved in translation (DUF1610 family)